MSMKSPANSPVVDVRLVMLTFSGDRLCVLLIDQEGSLELPSGKPLKDESLDQTASQLAHASLGFEEQYMEQLYSLSATAPDQWGISISYLALIGAENELPPVRLGTWVEINESLSVGGVDRMLIDYALFRLRAKLGYTTIAFHLMPPEFTLSELQTTFEAILGRTLDKRNFRRRMATLGILASTGEIKRDGSHRPARLYRFRPDRDPTDYLTPPWATSEPRE